MNRDDDTLDDIKADLQAAALIRAAEQQILGLCRMLEASPLDELTARRLINNLSSERVRDARRHLRRLLDESQ